MTNLILYCNCFEEEISRLVVKSPKIANFIKYARHLKICSKFKKQNKLK